MSRNSSSHTLFQLCLGVTGRRRRTYRGCTPCRSCPCCPQRAPAGSRCRGPCAPWCRRWPASPWGFRCMVLPTMLADLVRCALEQAHLVHGVQQLAVRRLEAVDLRQRAADDDAHSVGHIVGFQRAGDGVFQHAARVQNFNAVAQLRAHRLKVFLAVFLPLPLFIRLFFCNKLVSASLDRQSNVGALGSHASHAGFFESVTSTGERRHPQDTSRSSRYSAPCWRYAPCGLPGCRPAGCRTPARSAPHRWALP